MQLQLSTALRRFAVEESGAGEAAANPITVITLQDKLVKSARDERARGWPAFSATLSGMNRENRDTLRDFRQLVSQLIGSEVCSLSLIHPSFPSPILNVAYDKNQDVYFLHSTVSYCAS
jgi:hypothetical protein